MDGSRSLSREVSRGRTRRTSQSLAQDYQQQESRPSTPISVNERDQVYPPPRRSQSNSRPPVARKESTKSKRPRSSSRSERFKGTTVDNALSSIGRAARRVLYPNAKDIEGCPGHGHHYCLFCMTHLDLGGKVAKDGEKIDTTFKVDEPPVIEVRPCYGDAAQFDPAKDLQLRSKITAESNAPGPVPARYTTPNRKWFAYCSSCGVTYLVGKAGKNFAADHPSHCATDMGDKTTCVYVDAGVSKDEHGTLVGDSSVFFGPKSPLNAASKGAYDLEHQQTIQISALRRALLLSLKVMDQRKALVEKEAITNSYEFVWQCTQFRLLILSRMDAVNTWLEFDRNAIGRGQLDPRVEADLQKIDEDVMRLASQGIVVQFFPLPAFDEYEPEYEFFYDRFI
ncbi:uncharacterized protein PG986_012181 [Apiospora aurea]|uniref:Uncharacterized protein n=1 Tax=Apiospora aurea TaxID=335848 RepID=A0ABR1PZ99_9PEZI